MRLWIGAATLVGLTASARAEHHHMDHAEDPDHAFGAGVALVAASFDTMTFLGNYQGVVPSAQWSRGRFGAAANIGAYRIEENGAEYYALGDLMMHGRFALAGDPHASVGVMAGLCAPTGDALHGTGMGHVMVMPALYGALTRGRIAGSATIGYSRALGAEMDHDHGSWPLVEPMLMSEVSWSVGGDIALAGATTAGLRFAGGIPAGAAGDTRAQAGLRFAWHAGRVDSAAEIQMGLAGDPFTVRGVVSTALSF